MSILTISKEEMVQRKITSDKKNDTEKLVFENSNKRSSYGEAARAVRDRADTMNIQRLCTADDVSELEDMLNSLEC